MSALSALRARTTGWNRPMLVTAWAMAPVVVVSLVGLVVDDRILVGAPIWLKPLKFAVSIAVYGITWAWLISQLHVGKRLARGVSVVLAVVLLFEQALIVMQVLRGRGSHFNVMTTFDAAVFGVMGLSIAILWTGTLILSILVLRTPFADRATNWALRIGAVISLAGIGMGALMTSPTSAQSEAIGTDSFKGVIGAHTVGLEDGGPVMAGTGWSTVGGDLRVPHFVGMHALQVLPLLVLLMTVLAARVPVLRSEAVRVRLVGVLGAGYGLLFLLVLWQAERGQPVTAPDSLTLTAVAALVVAVALGSAWAVSAKEKEEVAVR